MGVPLSQMWTVASYVLRQEAARRGAISAGADARAADALQPGMRRLRQDSASGRRSCGGSSRPSNAFVRSMSAARRWFRFPAASRCCIRRSTKSWRAWLRGEKYVYLCTNAIKLEESSAAIQAVEISFVLDPPGWPARRARCRRLPRGRLRHRGAGDPAAIDAGFRVTTNTTLFNDADPRTVAPVLRHADGFGRRRDDDLAGLQLRAKRPTRRIFCRASKPCGCSNGLLDNRPRRWRFNQSPLFLEFLQGQLRSGMHAVGQSDLQHFRLAEALLLARRGLRANIPGTARHDRLERVRPCAAATQVPRLHGALRLRADGGERNFWINARHVGGGTSGAVWAEADKDDGCE